MCSKKKSLILALVMVSALLMAAIPAAAQDRTNTIAVTGTGTVTVAPDIVTIELGVETFNTDVKAAFSQANSTLRAVVDAVKALGVAEADINTSNLSIYNTNRYNPQSGFDERGYQISNNVRVTVRNVAQIEDVIDAAINAGANTIYGLTFDVADPSAAESAARAKAVADANARAAELAALVGASVGDVVAINESIDAFAFPQFGAAAMQSGLGGGGGAFVSPGQLTITVSVSVMYQLVR